MELNGTANRVLQYLALASLGTLLRSKIGQCIVEVLVNLAKVVRHDGKMWLKGAVPSCVFIDRAVERSVKVLLGGSSCN